MNPQTGDGTTLMRREDDAGPAHELHRGHCTKGKVDADGCGDVQVRQEAAEPRPEQGGPREVAGRDGAGSAERASLVDHTAV
ncbi:MAG: hypothetical protein AB7J32_16015 [Pseudonocardia sp.]